jgi:glutamine cyclotransferase
VALLASAPATAVEAIEYLVIGKRAHSRADFVQGLEIRDGLLYQGTGLVGRSRVQVFDLTDGTLLREQPLPPPYFGEGITVLGDQVIQLTWLRRKAFVYRRDSLVREGVFSLPGQGWGLTNDGERLIYSDGSHLLRFISPADWRVTGSLAVVRAGQPVKYLNELEWTSRGLFANVWKQDVVLRIDPASGEVTGEIDLTGLLPGQDRRPDTDVLNGIAWDADDNTLWVTGKNWPWLYQLRLLEGGTTGSEPAKASRMPVQSTSQESR